MKQVVQSYRTGELRVAEVPAPRCVDGGVLVATRVSLISAGTEKQLMDLAKASLAGKAVARPDLVRRVVRNIRRDGVRPTLEKVLAKLDTPIPLGYSIAGEVLEVGRKVQGLAIGDRVACAGAGLANHAEFNAVPKNLVVGIPNAVEDQDAAFVTLGAIALQGVRQAQLTLGERVAVMGLGLIGLLTVQLLKASGCRVLGFDPNPARAALAQTLGAEVAVSSDFLAAASGFTGGHGADAVIVTASAKSSEPLNQAAEASRLKGRIVVVGLVGMTLDREVFYKRELDLRLSMSYGPGRHDPSYELAGNDYPLPYVRWTEQRNMEAFLALVADGTVTPKALVTHSFAIHEAEKAYGLMESGEPHLAITLTYPETGHTKVARVMRRQESRRAPAENGVAFIGAGDYAKGVLLPILRKAPGIRLTTVATATGISADHSAAKFGFAAAATDPASVLADEETGIVFIATRHDTHARLTTAALQAGKHVFCEKPMAIEAGELQEVASAASAGPGVLTVGFNRRFAPLVVKAKSALEPRSGPLVMLYRVNAGAIPNDSWILRGEGGGRIIGEVCHFIDTLAFLADSLPIEAHAVAARDHADAVSILLRFADGSTGSVVYSSLGEPSVAKEYVEVFAAGRVVQIDDFRKLTVTAAGRRTVAKAPQDKGQAAIVAAFLAAVKGEREPPIPLAELVAVTRATFAVQDALLESGPATIEPEVF
jgi:predicted dehydrogenase/threonine dehydrogenase-like Zn-dependent dehydrogenase